MLLFLGLVAIAYGFLPPPPPPAVCTQDWGYMLFPPNPPTPAEPLPEENVFWTEDHIEGWIHSPVQFAYEVMCDMTRTPEWLMEPLAVLSPNRARTIIEPEWMGPHHPEHEEEDDDEYQYQAQLPPLGMPGYEPPGPKRGPSEHQIIETFCLHNYDSLYYEFVLVSEATEAITWKISVQFRDLGFGNTYVVYSWFIPPWTRAMHEYDFYCFCTLMIVLSVWMLENHIQQHDQLDTESVTNAEAILGRLKYLIEEEFEETYMCHPPGPPGPFPPFPPPPPGPPIEPPL